MQPSEAASSQAASPQAATEEEKPKLKICCACPETRKPRDECVVEKGEESCGEYIEAHKVCLRSHGFKVPRAHARSPGARVLTRARPSRHRFELRLAQ